MISCDLYWKCKEILSQLVSIALNIEYVALDNMYIELAVGFMYIELAVDRMYIDHRRAR